MVLRTWCDTTRGFEDLKKNGLPGLGQAGKYAQRMCSRAERWTDGGGTGRGLIGMFWGRNSMCRGQQRSLLGMLLHTKIPVRVRMPLAIWGKSDSLKKLTRGGRISAMSQFLTLSTASSATSQGFHLSSKGKTSPAAQPKQRGVCTVLEKGPLTPGISANGCKWHHLPHLLGLCFRRPHQTVYWTLKVLDLQSYQATLDNLNKRYFIGRPPGIHRTDGKAGNTSLEMGKCPNDLLV